MRSRCALFAALIGAPLFAAAAPLSDAEIEKVCAGAEDQSHCGRLIEEVQLKRLPNLAQRKDNALSVSLYPSGYATFTDDDDPVTGRSYSLWDFLDGINAVLLYTTQGDKVSFTLLQRTTNRRVELPDEPVVSPDRSRLLIADFCELNCANEVSIWRITPLGIRKELVWSPKERWLAAVPRWKDTETIRLEYTSIGEDKQQMLERRLTDSGWFKHVAP